MATPSVAFNPSTFDYGPIAANTTSLHTFVLTNSGGKATGTLKVDVSTGITGTSSIFAATADTCTGAKLAPKKSCSVTVQFAPTSSGSHYTGQIFARDIKPSTTFNATVDLTGGVSQGCGNLNDTAFFQGDYRNASASATPFKAGETMTMSAAEPSGGSPTGLSLTVNSAQVDTDSYPGTVQYVIPNDGNYSVGWALVPDTADATWTVSCTPPAP